MGSANRFITVEGNIGAGKTTLATLLSRRLHARLVLEEFADNPFLPKFYENPAQYAFPLELFFMAERYKQIKDMVQSPDLFGTITISDYLFTKSLLFARVNLADEEYRLYQKLFEIINGQVLQPDLLIYLHAPVTRLRQNIKLRNRSYEQAIPDSYLESIQQTYHTYLHSYPVPVLYIDVTHADFLNNHLQLDAIIEAIAKPWPAGQHNLVLTKT